MLFKALLVSSFGRGSARPLRTALLRLGGLAGGAAGLGMLFAQGTAGLQLASPSGSWALFYGCLLAIQVVLAATLLSGQTAGALPDDTMGRWLYSLPLGTAKRLGLLLLPALFLAGLSLLLVLPVLGALALQLGLPITHLAGAVIFGSASAFGLVYGLPWQLLAIPVVVWVEYKYRLPWLQGLLVVGLIGLGAHRLWHSACQAPKQMAGRVVQTSWLPPLFWFVKKVIRSKLVALAFATNLGLALGLAVFSQRQGLTDPASLGLFGALLAGSFCSDIRALARRYRPAEITGLRGTLWFTGAELVTALLAGAGIALPLALSLHGVPIVFVTQLLLGTALGFLAGTLLVPEARDLLSQFLALLLILLLLVGVPQLGLFVWDPKTHSVAALLAAAAAIWFELKRNNYIWRSVDAK